MRKELLCFASVLALCAGTAYAQDATSDPAAGTAAPPPAAQEQPADAMPPAGGDTGTAETMPPAGGDTGTDTGSETAEGAPASDPALSTDTAQSTATTGSGEQVSVDDMVGRQVVGADGNPLGEVDDVIVDPQSGEVRRLVISSGGFLGIGAKRVAVDMADAEIRPEEGIFLSSVTQQDIESMPEFVPEEETSTLDAPAPAGDAAPATGGGMATPPAAGQ